MGDLVIKVYHVGDGDCIFIRFPDGTCGLVDSHKPSWLSQPPALNDIRSSGNILAFVCLTHPHSDHYTGMMDLFSDNKITVREFWHTLDRVDELLPAFNERGFEENSIDALRKQYHESQNVELLNIYKRVNDLRISNKITVRRLNEGQLMSSFGGVDVWSMSPSDTESRKFLSKTLDCLNSKKPIDQSSANYLSSVLLLRYGSISVFLGADAPQRIWKRILVNIRTMGKSKLLPSPVIKVSHHGAADDHLPVLLDAIKVSSGQPCAVISAGSATHPTRSTMEYLKRDGREIYTTGLGGPPFRSSSILPETVTAESAAFLDSISDGYEPSDPCCGDVTVTVNNAGSVNVETQRTPICGICGPSSTKPVSAQH